MAGELEILMIDGSTFKMRSKHWQKAFLIKYGEDPNSAINAFRELTKEHFDAKTVPTKFGTTVAWGEDYGADEIKKTFKNHAELGEQIMYVYLRSALLAVVMEEASKQMGRKTSPSVLAIGEDGQVTEYTGFGKRKPTTIDKVLKQKSDGPPKKSKTHSSEEK
jgi:hypothetical protein